jgi:hypothetical protein
VIQKNPKSAFNDKNNPIQIVMNNNEPQGLIISWEIAKPLLQNNFFSQIKNLPEWEQKAIDQGLRAIENQDFASDKDVEKMFNRLNS